MNIKLFLEAILKVVSGFLLTMLLLFWPAGTFNYPGAWLFIGILFIPMIVIGIILMIKNPELLKKRLKSKETEKKQILVVLLSSILFIAVFIIAGLDFRYKWFMMPDIVSYIASAFFILSYVMYAKVLKDNSYVSRVVEVQEGQKVIDTGLYAVIRHPLYTATIIMFLSIPLVLGSLFAFILIISYVFIIALRIKDEEKILEKELKGYSEYKKKVKYRLIPFIW